MRYCDIIREVAQSPPGPSFRGLLGGKSAFAKNYEVCYYNYVIKI